MDEPSEVPPALPDPFGRNRQGEAFAEPTKAREFAPPKVEGPSPLAPVGELRRSEIKPAPMQMISGTGRRADGSMESREKPAERLTRRDVLRIFVDRLRSVLVYWFGYGITLEVTLLVASLWESDVQGETGAVTTLLGGPLVGLTRDIGLGPFGWFFALVELALGALFVWHLDWRMQLKIGVGAMLLIVLKIVILAQLNPFLS